MTDVKDLTPGAKYLINHKAAKPIPYTFNGFDMGKRPVFVSELGLFAFSKKLESIPVTLAP